LSARWFRIIMNLWPPFFALRIHIVASRRLADITIRMKLSLRNRIMSVRTSWRPVAMTDPFSC